MTIEIRSARVDDYAAIDALALEAWQVLKPGYDASLWFGLLQAIGHMSQLAATGALIVAADDAELHGAVAYMPSGTSNPRLFPEGWPTMRMLVVRPASRGRGLGKRLAEACIQLAQSDGAPCIGLHTSPIMTIALPMYLRRGFVKDADLPTIAGAPYERYVLHL